MRHVSPARRAIVQGQLLRLSRVESARQRRRRAQAYTRPANLTWIVQMPKRQGEPYLYWTIAEGGQEFGSDMPAFKTKLSRNDIWAVISYVRTVPARDRRP